MKYRRLRDDPRPIDRIDAGERGNGSEGVVIEQPFTIAGSLQGASIASAWTLSSRRWSSCAAARRDASMREQHEDVGADAPAEGFDRSAPVSPRSRHDRGALAARGQHMSIRRPRSCMQSLEGERRPWKSSSMKSLAPYCDSGATAPDGGNCVGLPRQRASPAPGWHRRRTAGSRRTPPPRRAVQRIWRSAPASSRGQDSGT